MRKRSLGTIRILALLWSLLCIDQAAAEGKAQGFVVTTHRAPLYERQKGDRILRYVNKGVAVAGYNSLDHALTRGQTGGWFGRQENGRVQVMAFIADDRNNKTVEGWMNKQSLSPFSYECGCGSNTAADRCSPFIYQSKGFSTSVNWNMCFEEARSQKLNEMQEAVAPAQEPVKAAVTPTTGSTISIEERLRRLDDLKKKGLITEEEYKAKRAEILKDM